MTKGILTLYLLALYQSDVCAFSTPQPNRQDFIRKLAIGIASVALPQVANAAAIENSEGRILRSDKCAYGEGEGCESLAGDNEFIKNLQRKSAEKKEAVQKENLIAYQQKNYPDFFASLSPPKYMVKKSDGTFNLYDDVELSELKKANRIKMERPTAMGGKVLDLTQKPVMVLVE
eukprot:scaffold478_cov235-Chaetoceros_neogracile.AAC.4